LFKINPDDKCINLCNVNNCLFWTEIWKMWTGSIVS